LRRGSLRSLGSLRRAAARCASIAALAACLPACSVDTLEPESRPAIPNSCKENADCGSNGVCTNGECFSRIGAIEEVLLEIAPEATSAFGGISFLSMQDNVHRGARGRSIALAGPVSFTAQVVVSGEDHAVGCPDLRMGKQTVPARIQFDRTGSVGGVSVSGLSENRSVIVDTDQSPSGFSKNVSLVPGFYDIYAQPVTSPTCRIAAKVWRGVAIARDGEVVPAWAPPATLELPKPLTLNGRVERKESLADWQVEILDPQDGKVISTAARLGATTVAAPVTNFEITYQPPAPAVSMLGSNSMGSPGGTAPLIRLKPPKDTESTSPTVYFDLVGAISGEVNLVVSNLPTAAQLVRVSGQVRGTTNVPVRATVKFLNSTIQGLELPASFGPAVTTDGNGHYETKLFPGAYRVIVIPEGATDNGSAAASANPDRWALTVEDEVIRSDAAQELDLTVVPVRIIEGVASAGRTGVVAQGATLEAAAVTASSLGFLRAVIDPPPIAARASVPVADTSGGFKIVLDPGDYVMSLKPAPASNFAWWILPKVNVYTAGMPGHIGTVNPQLLYPVPLEGKITVAMANGTSQPLRNATVQAYALTRENVVKVGTARTDDTGHYYLALPPSFGSVSPPAPPAP